MSLQVEKLEKNMAKLTVEVSAEDLEKAIEKAYQKQKKQISIPGFRKGKVPRQIVEKMYGREVFYEDAANALIPDAYDKALEEKKGKDFLFKNLQKFANNKSFVDKMQYEPHEAGDVLLLTGVGEVFPFMRIHSLLEALQPEFPDIPILVMYPGKYDGRFVRLFDKLEPNPYYRAFNIVGGADK